MNPHNFVGAANKAVTPHPEQPTIQQSLKLQQLQQSSNRANRLPEIVTATGAATAVGGAVGLVKEAPLIYYGA